MSALPLRLSLGARLDGFGFGAVLCRTPLYPAQDHQGEYDRNEEPENVVDAGAVREHHVNHQTDAIATARLQDAPGRGQRHTRFGMMKKALKILVVVALVGIIGKIIIDNA
ncbi:MAG TPA: hypothetical protein VIW46_03205 [Acidimicrobiia bacterium]